MGGGREREREGRVSWCFEPSQRQRITSGLKERERETDRQRDREREDSRNNMGFNYWLSWRFRGFETFLPVIMFVNEIA